MCQAVETYSGPDDCHNQVCRGKIFSLLLKVGKILSEDNNLNLALDELLGYMHKEMGFRRAMISLLHRESGQIFTYRSLGLTQDEESKGVYFMGEGVTGKVIESACPMIVPRIGNEPSFLNRTGSVARKEDLDMAFLCLPIARGRKVLGSISAVRSYHNQEALFKHAEVLGVMANILSQALELYLVENIDKVKLENRIKSLVGRLRDRFQPPNIIGTSPAMQQIYELIRKVSASRTTVLLLGESGVGKEMIADALHFGGLTPEGPLIKFNCAALPESIVESELFGHEKGAFTGAIFHIGKFEAADKGTIFLDEIGEMPLQIQAKLLRILQEKKFERVGGNRSISSNMRVITATNRDLSTMVKEGSFREDLYYRLNVFPITVPPLRERGTDIITLAEYFMELFATEMLKKVNSISTQVINIFLGYPWPGNVRELENVIHRAVILTEDEMIHVHDLPLSIQNQRTTTGDWRPSKLQDRLEAIEREMLVESLRKNNGHISSSAEVLGLTRRTMGLRMKRFGLTYKEFRKVK